MATAMKAPMMADGPGSGIPKNLQKIPRQTAMARPNASFMMLLLFYVHPSHPKPDKPSIGNNRLSGIVTGRIAAIVADRLRLKPEVLGRGVPVAPRSFRPARSLPKGIRSQFD